MYTDAHYQPYGNRCTIGASLTRFYIEVNNGEYTDVVMQSPSLTPYFGGFSTRVIFEDQAVHQLGPTRDKEGATARVPVGKSLSGHKISATLLYDDKYY